MKKDWKLRAPRPQAVLIGICTAATMGFIIACASKPAMTPLPESRWAAGYNYNFQPPSSRKPASVQLNIVVVQPERERDSVLVERLYQRVSRGFSRSMGVDLDKILVAKGMTALGPYAALDDVTFPDKRAADLTLAPRVFLNTEAKFTKSYNTSYSGIGYIEKPFTMRISGWVSYEMREPLSGQKMWIKRLDLDEREVRGVEIYEAIAARKDQYGNVVDWREGEIKISGREDALADALAAYYPEIMGRAWTYLDTDELLDLKVKTKDIRERIQAPLR